MELSSKQPGVNVKVQNPNFFNCVGMVNRTDVSFIMRGAQVVFQPQKTFFPLEVFNVPSLIIIIIIL